MEGKVLDTTKTYSFDGRPKPKDDSSSRPKGPLDVRSLKQAVQFTIVFMDSKAIKGKLLEIDNYNLLVESSTGNKLLIPKHSIKYIML